MMHSMELTMTDTRLLTNSARTMSATVCLLGLLLLLLSCSVPLNPDSYRIHRGALKKSNLSACLIIPEKFRKYIYNRDVLGTTWTLEVGPVISKVFEAEMGKIFSTVSAVENLSLCSEKFDSDSALVLEPEIESFLAELPVGIMGYGTYSSEIKCKVHVYNSRGQELLTIWEVGNGTFENKSDVYPKPAQWLGDATNRAIEDVMGKIVKALSDSELTKGSVDTGKVTPPEPKAAAAEQGIAFYEKAKKDFFEDLNYAAALMNASKAVEAFSQCQPGALRDRYLVDAQILTGAVYMKEGVEKMAREAFRKAVEVNPSLEPDRLMYPPDVIEMYRKVKATSGRP
jgi:hypothetical protein